MEHPIAQEGKTEQENYRLADHPYSGNRTHVPISTVIPRPEGPWESPGTMSFSAQQVRKLFQEIAPQAFPSIPRRRLKGRLLAMTCVFLADCV